MRIVATLVALLVGCSRPTQVEFFTTDDGALTADEKALVETIAVATIAEVKQRLPSLPERITVQVYPSRDVIAETGESGTTGQPAHVIWYVDPTRDVAAVARKWLRACLFHELHHLARDARVARSTILDRAVTEGMATVFERDFAGADPPWAHYPPEVQHWVEELRQLPANTLPAPWITHHPDGRRWVALKAGTFVVERAMKASSRSSADMVLMPTEDIMNLCRQADACSR